jgi:hypothetical protein
MARIRVSTTVDGDLLAEVRDLDPDATDASLLDRAFTALLAQSRRAEIDRQIIAAYAAQPADKPDAWGDLVSFSDAVGGQ